MAANIEKYYIYVYTRANFCDKVENLNGQKIMQENYVILCTKFSGICTYTIVCPGF